MTSSSLLELALLCLSSTELASLLAMNTARGQGQGQGWAGLAENKPFQVCTPTRDTAGLSLCTRGVFSAQTPAQPKGSGLESQTSGQSISRND